jgi:hypothetical protein
MSVLLKENYEPKVNATFMTRRLATFFMEITCGKSCLNFDGDGKIKEYR